MTVAELVRALPQAMLQGDGRVRFNRVSTDSRTIEPGALFVALRGERFDGHDHAAQAVERGAVALLVEHALDLAVPQVICADSKRGLGLAAAAWRARFDLPLIAVAGSNGKTTVTQMIAAILGQAQGEKKRLATRGNFNNDIGVPLMLFELNAQHRVGVLEVGMNHPGEIEYLAQLVKPTVAVVNNAQREHQEFMAGVEATAVENGAVIDALPADGVAVFPADDACAPIWRRQAGTRRVLDFAREGEATVTADVARTAQGSRLSIASPAGLIEVDLPVPGAHNVHNALAATAAAIAVGVAPADIAVGLAGFTPVKGRGVRHTLSPGALLVDDSYNANPDSVRAAIDLLATLPAPRTLVLGDMGEVGHEGPAFHREVGAYAAQRGIDALLTHGEAAREAAAAFGAGARHLDGIDALIEAARVRVAAGGALLVKGSRFMRMERVVQALLQTAATADAPGAQKDGAH